MSTITLKQETGVTVEVTLSDADGGVDLTGATATIYVRRRGAVANKFEAALTPDADQVANKGKATFTTVAAHVADPGLYRWEAKAEWAGGVVRRFPNDGIGAVYEVVPSVEVIP